MRVICLFVLLLATSSQPAARQAAPVGRSAPHFSGDTGCVIGRVVDSERGTALGDAAVVLFGPGTVKVDAVWSAADGTFFFGNLPAGTWSLGAVKPGYAGTSGRRLQVTIARGQCVAGLVIRLDKFAAMGGTVVDEAGRPIAGVPVRELHRGQGRWVFGLTAVTDDRGAYHFSMVYAGRHTVAVVSTQATIPAAQVDVMRQTGVLPVLSSSDAAAPSGAMVITDLDTKRAARIGNQVLALDRAPLPARQTAEGRPLVYPTTFYPNAPTPAAARFVTLAPASDQEGLDLQLVPVPAVPVSGMLRDAAGPVGGEKISLRRADAGGLRNALDVAQTISDRAGRFVFPFVPAGTYVATVLDRPRLASTQTRVRSSSQSRTLADAAPAPAPGLPTDSLRWASTTVEVSDTPIDGLVVPVHAGHRVRGRIVFEGSATPAPPDRWSPVAIQIWTADGRDPGFYTGRATANGEFATAALPGGRFILSVVPPAPWTLKSVIVHGRDVADDAFNLSDEDLTDVTVTVTDAGATIAGTVRDEAGMSATTPTVLVFSADRRFWGRPRINARRLKMTRASASGAYTVTGLPPGAYYVVAIAGTVDNGWTDEPILAALAVGRTPVSIHAGENLSVPLRALSTLPVGGRPQPPAVAPALWLQGRDEWAAETQPAIGGPFIPEEDGQGVRVPRIPSRTPGDVGRIEGRLVLAGGSAQPVQGATITVWSSKHPVTRAAFTDDRGRFVVADLPPGRYHVSASKAAYLTVEYGARRVGGVGVSLPIDQGRTTSIRMAIARGAVVSGSVVDESGGPVPSVDVTILRLTQRGRVPLLMAPDASGPTEVRTDDRGAFRFYGLPPGDYYVGATPGLPSASDRVRRLTDAELRWLREQAGDNPTRFRQPTPIAQREDDRAAPVGYAATFYPSASTLAEASTISVRAGEERTGSDIRLRRTTHVSLSGRLVGSDGRTVAAAQLVLAPAGLHLPSDQGLGRSGTARSNGGLVSLRPASDGSFRIDELTPGAYRLLARTMPGREAGPRAGGAQRAGITWASVDVTIGDRNVEDLEVTLKPAATVEGTVRATGASPPPRLSGLRVSLTPVQKGTLSMTPAPARVDVMGRFMFPGLIPGTYAVSVDGSLGQWVLASAVGNGHDAFDFGFVVGEPNRVAALDLSLTDRAATLTGSLADRTGRPATEYSIILFPTEERLWTPASQRLYVTRPGADGVFTLPKVLPGEYFLCAVTDVRPSDLDEPTFLKSLMAEALRLSLADGERKVEPLVVGGGR